MSVEAKWKVVTPAMPGAVAILEITGDVTAALRVLGLGEVPLSAVVVRDLMGMDRGVVARWSEEYAQLMAHGGVAVVAGLIAKLEDAGIGRGDGVGAWRRYPEAMNEVEARALAALARAKSPGAVDLLLDQARRWAKRHDHDVETDRLLRRLIEPALVVAVGPANIGKSTLINALAGRSVAVVADEPGTTRDHVGVMVDFGGVVTRYLDTPGLREDGDELEREAWELTLRAARGAAVLLECHDPATREFAVPERVVREIGAERVVRVELRADLEMEKSKRREGTCIASVKGGWGVAELADVIREAIVPREVLEEREKPWKFW